MSTNQRKAKRAGDLVRRAQSAKELEKQLEDVRALLDIANRVIIERDAELKQARDRFEDLRNATGRTVELTNKHIAELEAQCVRHAENTRRLETAARERGEHIEQLIVERNNARAAKQVAERKLHTLHLEDRDSKKLRRRLVEAKSKIEELQTEVCRLKKSEEF
jgi:5-bromo-4-chloroindolyl phosphate hydrolysis protein